MTNEEAVKYTEQCIDRMRDCIDRHQEKGFPVGEMQETLEYYECVLAALKCEKKPTGEPLTLNQLREMLENDGGIIGAAVIVSEHGVLIHAVLDSRVEDGICASTGASEEWLKEKDYGKTWLAYAYPPTYIDREAWVSVKCRMPAPEQDVLLAFETGRIAVGGKYDNEDGWYSITDAEYYTDCDTPPLYWKPLLELPTELENRLNQKNKERS